jgi:hypothetical protein
MSTESIAVIGAIATVLAGFGGAALGACFAYKTGIKLVQETHKNATDLLRRQEFNKASTKFRNAFLPELIFLKHNAKISSSASSDNLHEFLLAGYVHRHLKALEIFRNYLSTKERTNIDKAWQKYCRHPDNSEILYFEQYSNKSINGTQKSEANLKKVALERIEAIIKITEHK